MRITIILESHCVAAWIALALQEIKRIKKVSLSILVIKGSESKTNFAFWLFKKLDHTLLSGDIEYTKLVSIDDLKVGSECIEINEIGHLNTHLIINFTQLALPVNSISGNHEIWTIQIGEANAGGFWEWFHRKPVTKISIEQLKKGSTNCHTSAVTKTEYLCYSRNETPAYAKTIDVLVLAVRDWANGVTRKSSEPFSVVSHAKKPTAIPSAIACLKLFYRLSKKTLNKLFFIEQWAILFSTDKQEFFNSDFSKFKSILPPKDRIWADPFVVSRTDTHYVFIEEMPLSTRRGHISCLILNGVGEITDSKKIIEKSYHLSYPFVFQHEGTWFMIPESGENKTIDLYECTDFPFQWKFRKNLIMNIQAYDATLHVQDGLFLLFCTIQNHVGGSPNNDLHIFYAENLFGDWTPHTLNPVITDPYTARPAGRIFLKDGVLYRPSQICVPRYGYGLSLNKIVTLTKDAYQEEQISKALPDWNQNQLATHTLNFSENFSVIDALIKRGRFF